MALISKTAALLGLRWFRCDAALRWDQRFENQPTQACACPLEVLPLRSLGLSADQNSACGVHATTCKLAQALLLGLGQRSRTIDVESKSHLRRELVHVLTARAGRTGSAPRQVTAWDAQLVIDCEAFHVCPARYASPSSGSPAQCDLVRHLCQGVVRISVELQVTRRRGLSIDLQAESGRGCA